MTSREIAIVGVGCRVAPDVRGPAELWAFLEQGGDAVGDLPPDRWSWEAFYDPDPAKVGKMHVRRGAFLQQPFEELDARFFHIAPREAAQLDPQQRLLLEVSWEAFEDAGLDVWALQGSSTGVFLGAFMLDNLLQRMDAGSRDMVGPQTAMTCTNTVLASRLSYFYDLRGPSLVVDTACSSSLVATHHGVAALAAGDCDLALVGGVNRIFRPEPMLLTAKGRFLAPDGRSKAFSARADGYGRGEGCGLVVLKRLADAEADGDRVYAVIEGSGVNQDGRTGGPASPSADAQAALVRAVVEDAGVDPAGVAFVEAHGTGTPVGDPAEMQALGEVLGQAPGRDAPCVVGAIKAGIGHLEGAAGIMGLIKAALVAREGDVPPQAWLEDLSTEIDFAGLGLRVADRRLALDDAGRPRRVAVNSFGYGGTNAHVLLREHRERHESRGSGRSTGAVAGEGFFPDVAVVSAQNDGALAELAGLYARELGAVPAGRARPLLARMASRTAHEVRAVVASREWPLADLLGEVAAGRSHPDVVRGTARSARPARPVFVFSGMGPQWWAMGRGLLETHGGFRAHVERCDAVHRRLAGWSLLDALGASEDESRMTSTAVAQPCSFVLQTGLAEVLREVGVVPAAVVGHSAGEVAAAYVTGVLSLDDALAVAWTRSRLQATTAGTGAMLATELSEDMAAEVVAACGADVSIAAVNGARATTLAGDPAALERIAADLADRDVFCAAVPVDVAYHSPTMDPILGDLHDGLAGIAAGPATIPLYSTVAAEHDGGGWDAAYWVANARRPVAFAPALRRITDDGHRLFLELGAHPVLGLYIRDHLRAADGLTAIPTLHRRKSDRQALTETLAQLWVAGAAVDWAAVLGAARPLDLPLYPWQRERHWQETDSQRRSRTGQRSDEHVLGGQVVSVVPQVRDVELSPAAVPWARSHLVDGERVLPATGLLEAVLAAARGGSGELPVVVRDLRIDRPVVLAESADTVLRVALDPRGGQVTVASRQRGESPIWHRHATARIGTGRHRPPPDDDADGAGWQDVAGSADELYARLDDLGLHYEGDFRAVRRIRHRGGRVEVLASCPGGLPAGYTAYPPLLDAVLHGALAAGAVEGGDLWVPVRIDQAVVHQPLPAEVVATTTIAATSEGRLGGDVTVRDVDGRCLAELRGVELQRVGRRRPDDVWLDIRTYGTRWVAPDRSDAPEDPDAPDHSDDPGGADGAGPPRQVVLYAPPAGLAERISAARPEVAVTVRGDLDDAAGDDLAGRTVVFVASPDVAAAQATLERAVALLTTAAAGGTFADLLFVTTGAAAVTGDDRVGAWWDAGIAGLRRVAANELASVRVRHVDDDGADPDLLRDVVLRPPADEVALRAGRVHRVQVDPLATGRHLDHWWRTAPSRSATSVESFALASTGRGPDELTWVAATRRAPGPDEIELRVEAVGLNYKDVAKQLGRLDAAALAGTFVGTGLGMEAVVVVERVGTTVTRVQPGERYVATVRGGIFARYVTVAADDTRLLAAVDGWSEIESTALLVAFGTAHHTIVELGRVRPGDTVLLHGATGAVGLAALQVARHHGARVVATAGTPDKREVLRKLGVAHTFDSRTLNFVDEARAVTGGRGVDLVVNTLYGDGLQANLEVAAEGGRIVDIAKRDIIDDTALPLGMFDKALTLSSFDLDRHVTDPRRFQALAAGVLARVHAGVYTPLPVTAFPAAAVTDAFALQARAGHVGKVAVDLRDVEDLVVHDRPGPAGPIRHDRWYLVSGGTGGVGQQLAAWLAARGARHLVLLSRRPHLDAAGEALCTRLAADGVEVRMEAVDVRDLDAVRASCAALRATGMPIGGVVHAAGVSNDKPIVDVTAVDARAVIEPKVVGAANLHAATLDDPVELFLVTSSVSALTGTTGQATYAAANAALDAFAHWRRRQGRPACAVGLGPVADVGMAANSPMIRDYVELLGFHPLPLDRLPAVFDRALAWNHPTLAVFDLDWSLWSRAEPRAAASPRFAGIVDRTASSGGTVAWLARLPADERVAALARHVTTAVESVVGLAPGDLAPDASLGSLGLDSLMLLELQTTLNHSLGTELSLIGLLGMDTIADVAVAIEASL